MGVKFSNDCVSELRLCVHIHIQYTHTHTHTPPARQGNTSLELYSTKTLLLLNACDFN